MIQIGQNIAKFRKFNDVTQAQLAEYLGVSPQAVSKWEQESATPDIFLLPKIALFFHVSIDALFGSTDLEQAELLVSKYYVRKTEQSYNEAKEALDSLIARDCKDKKVHHLLYTLSMHRATDLLLFCQDQCKMYLSSFEPDNSMEYREAFVSLMHVSRMLGDFDFLSACQKNFEQSASASNFNFYLIALGEYYEYEKIIDLCRKHLNNYSTTDPHQIFNAWWLMWRLYINLDILEQAEHCKTELLHQFLFFIQSSPFI